MWELTFLPPGYLPVFKSACEIITTLLSLFIIGIVVWQGWVEGIGERAVSDMLRIPQYPFRLLVAVGGFLLWLELLIDLLISIGKLKGRESVNPVTVGILGSVLLVFLLFLGMPIAFVMMFVGFLGISYLASANAALPVVAKTVYETAAHYPYTIIPLFILMGGFAGNAGITRELYQSFDKWFRKTTGGIGYCNHCCLCLFCRFKRVFGGRCSGHGDSCYSGDETLQLCAEIGCREWWLRAAPSAFSFRRVLGFVVYGMLTEQSIGKLLISGIFPGLLLSLAFMASSSLR